MADGKAVVITGVSRGLGRAMVSEFVRLGHTVIGCGRSASAAEELSSEHGDRHSFAQHDRRGVVPERRFASLVGFYERRRVEPLLRALFHIRGPSDERIDRVDEFGERRSQQRVALARFPYNASQEKAVATLS